MKSWTKVTIIVVLLLAVVGIYYGKNIYFKKDAGESAVSSNLENIIQVEKGELKKPVVMELSTTTCPVCVKMYPIMESIDKKYKDKVVVGVVHLDDEKIQEKAIEYAQKYSVRVVPTMIFMDENGETFLRQEGYMSEEEISKVLKAMGVE
ncbi:thioredoxin family protein [Clostridium ganghwense]|uniref:Thioredoxin family protein n=1 Tax=Clostridium ganghwense TaxID=312089 RepID=A0ABT4CMB2_9CLOT|nr:thioredoxin family protein [Clostridium ganghwense]MCY6370187.1 thioredoxin family protein [Clostridium ganghwense]